MVITGLTRNQFVLTHTRVRIPLSPPKSEKHPHLRVLSCFFVRIQMGFERSEQNNTVRCFVNGDRRFLHDVTKDNIRNVGQKSRTNPSLRQQKRNFCLPKVPFLFIHCESNGISSRCSRGYHHRRCISSTVGCIAFAMMIYNAPH